MCSSDLPNGWREMYAFNLEPQLPSDAEQANWFTSTNPSAPFTGNVIVERVDSTGRYKLINRRYVKEAREGDVVEERMISDAQQFAESLEKYFGVIVPAAVTKMFRNIPAE